MRQIPAKLREVHLEEKEHSAQELVTTYKEQGGVERGFRFLKDPLFLASSVFVKKYEKIYNPSG